MEMAQQMWQCRGTVLFLTVRMRDDIEFNVRFIEMVESKPCLYDYNRSDYCKRYVQDAAWSKIAREINETASDCKDRWRNIRGSYTKYLHKKLPSGSLSKAARPYYLAEHLHFLQPFTKSRKLRGDIQQSQTYSDVDLHSSQNIRESSDSESESENEDSNQNVSKLSTEQIQKEKEKDKRRYMSTIQDMNETALECFQGKKKKLEENFQDPDLAFFVSMLPDMKKMSDHQKRQFKIAIIKLTGEILEESGSSLSIQQFFSLSPKNEN